MIVLRELALAKINLCLHVTGKRSDGYHTLDSLVVFADVADKLEVTPADDVALAFDGPNATAMKKQSKAQENSVLKAASAMRAHFKITTGVHMTLHKHLPIGAGLGGGAADAAAALRLLTRFWRLKPTPQELHAIALSIGADVPACLRSQSLYMSGIGETIEAGPPIADMYLVLVNPNKPLLTKDVFTRHKAAFSSPLRHPATFASQLACVQFLQKTKNDLQETAQGMMPEITTILKLLSAQEGCQLARMSGSGATCFGIFPTQEMAQSVATTLAAQYPAWWIKSSAVR